MSYQPVIIESGVSFIFMTVGLLVAAGSLKHFFPQKKKKEQTEGNREPNSGNAQQLGPLPVRQCGRFLGSTFRKGRSLVCLLTVSASKLKIYVLQRQFYVSIFFVVKATKNRPKKKKLSLRSIQTTNGQWATFRFHRLRDR